MLLLLLLLLVVFEIVLLALVVETRIAGASVRGSDAGAGLKRAVVDCNGAAATDSNGCGQGAPCPWAHLI